MTSSNDLQSLLKRIEKATTRLEELAAKRSEAKDSAANNSKDTTNEAVRDSKDTTNEAVSDSKAVREYDALQPLVAHYVECSDKIDGAVGEQAHVVGQLFAAQRSFVQLVAATKRPAPAQLPVLLGAQQGLIERAVALRDASRGSEWFDHLSAVAEGVAAFGWVVVEPAPVPYITDMRESAEFYTNRVLKRWREADPRHAEWVKALLAVFCELAAYVKQFHKTGLAWNKDGADPAGAVQALTDSAAAPAASGAPPPPPPMPSAAQLEPAPGAAGDGSGRGALFAALNSGDGATAGLRKVAKDQMTHKNPSLRAAGTVKGSSTAKDNASSSSKKPAALPPRMELQKDKWVVENYGTEHLTIEATATWQTVYMYNCRGTTLDIKNKLNSIAIDGCEKCGVVFDALVSQCEVVNSRAVQVQARATVPSILIDRTDGAHVFLSEAARDQTQITTAKASEVNVSFPFETANPDDDNFVEQPVPEQLQSVVRNGKLVTSVLEHTG